MKRPRSPSPRAWRCSGHSCDATTLGSTAALSGVGLSALLGEVLLSNFSCPRIKPIEDFVPPLTRFKGNVAFNSSGERSVR